ncbi:Blue copper oxidase CueO [Phytophthora citrophthora]|uniref:Blue copper oxidase CueO n=1 Tax=Phytophthora citrophthora TaxID=4793 RepID=A0AAD9LDU9_9STRA|nr:Blue copper oxidase CueO [Phytophthora citrophthora]
MALPTAADGSRKRSAGPRSPRNNSYGTGVFCESKRADEAETEDADDDAKDNDFFLRRGARQLQTQSLRLRRNVACTFVVGMGIVVLLLMAYVHQERSQSLRVQAKEPTTRVELLNQVLQQLPELPTLEKRVSVNGRLDTSITVSEKLVNNGPIAFYTRAYEDSVPGPMLVLKPGDLLNIHLTNNLGPNVAGEWTPNTMHEPNNTNLHFHGMHVDPTGTEDNVFRIVAPGESADTHLHVPLNHPRGLFHYHPHFHGSVFLQMGGGMVGPIVVEDDPETVPAEYAAIKQRHVVVLQEFKFSGGMMTSLPEAAKASRSTLDMQLTYTGKVKLDAQVRKLYPDVQEIERPVRNAKMSKELLEEMDSSEEKPQLPPIAQYFSVNGEYLPKIEVRPHENVLLRMLHAGGTASLEVQVPGCSIMLAASDGLYMPKPRPMETVILLPGARVDVVLNCEPTADGGPEELRPIQSVKDPKLHNFMGNHSDLYSGVLAFVHVQGESLDEPLITAVPPPSELYGPSKSLLELSAEDRAGMDPLPFEFEFTMGDPVMKDGFYYKPYYINHALFDGTSIRTMMLGRVQEWVIINRRDESGEVTLKNHPFHLHTNAFQIVDMSHGHGIDYEIGDWRDVISVPTPGNVTIRFRPEDYTGIVAAHCHILGHSDAGMIAGVDMISGD